MIYFNIFQYISIYFNIIWLYCGCMNHLGQWTAMVAMVQDVVDRCQATTLHKTMHEEAGGFFLPKSLGVFQGHPDLQMVGFSWGFNI